MSDNLLTLKKDYNSAQIQELNDVRQFLKIRRTKYNQCKILYDAVQECISTSNDLDPVLKLKIKQILLSPSCAQVLPLENDNTINRQSSNLLGITLNSDKLTYNEGTQLNQCVVKALQKKYESICEEFAKITHRNVDEVKPQSDFMDLSTQEHALFDFKLKLDEQQHQYVENLLEEQRILDDIAKLRINDLAIECNKKMKEYELTSYMNGIKTKIVEESTRVGIFTETNHSLRAYEECLKDIKEQQEECKKDIAYLKKLKEKYNQISCKQFDDLLKSYIQYKTSLEKKKLIYESLKG